MEQFNNTERPEHYNTGEIEPIDAIKDWLLANDMNAWEGFCAGNVIKYIARAGLKGDKAEDIQKATNYMKMMNGEDFRDYLNEEVTETQYVTQSQPTLDSHEVRKHFNEHR